MKIRFATIGTNFVTQWFVDAAATCPELEYAATYSRSPQTAQAFAHLNGAGKIHTDLQELAEDHEIDAVYIASPNSLHHGQAILMMNHGKHVLCEKAIASNVRELNEMLAAARNNKVVLLEAMRLAYDPGLATIQQALAEIAPVRRASLSFCKYSSRYDNFKRGIIENAFNPSLSNGALMDIGVYCVHLLVRLFGAPKSIHADSLFLPNGIDGAGTILANYEGMQAELLYSKISDNHLPSQIQGENGTILIDMITSPRQITLIRRDGSRTELGTACNESNMIYEVREWIQLIQSHQTDHPHHIYTQMEMELMDEARRQCQYPVPSALD